MWECEFSRFQEMNPVLENFVKSFKCLETLNPRESLFGGRTNSIKLYHKCEPNEKIMYVDYKSLYPSVQKYCEFPIGHPTLITENFQSIENYFGLVKCSIIPPRKLHIPVLPVKVDGKLYFPLCFTCAKLKLTQCLHNDNERELTGTWATLEVQTELFMVTKLVKFMKSVIIKKDLLMILLKKNLKVHTSIRIRFNLLI